MSTPTSIKDQLALKGAAVRLSEITLEIEQIYQEFPELKRTGVVSRRGKRVMSAGAKARMSAGMRAYWKRRKAAEAKKG